MVTFCFVTVGVVQMLVLLFSLCNCLLIRVYISALYLEFTRQMLSLLLFPSIR